MPCISKHHPLAIKDHRKPKAGLVWPSFTGTAQLIGTSATGRVTVYVDASLGSPVIKNGTDLLANADKICAQNDQLFGTTGGHVDVIIFALGGATDGTGGADHMACDYVNGAQIEVCADFGNSSRVYALFEAELSECAMGGNLCGQSTGEALSRWCAIYIAGNVLQDFASAPVWANHRTPNWVDITENTDQNYDSIGCGMAFLSWLMGKQGYTLAQIAQKMVKLGDGGTLSALVAQPASAWPSFMAAITGLGGPTAIISDDPFNGLGAPRPAPTPVPAPVPVPALPTAQAVGNVIFTDLSTGVSRAQLIADIQAALANS